MALYSEEFIRRVRDANDIVQVVESYQIPLRRVGVNWVGLCPFHREKTPSFNVRPADQIFRCFGCDAKGDVISFVMLAGRLDFAAAVAELAQRAGLAPEYADPRRAAAVQRDGARKQGLFWLTSKALAYFEESLWVGSGPDAVGARQALDYLRGRGFSDDTIRAWRLGWAPERWDGFLRRLRAAESDPARRARLLQYAAAAGLVRRANRDGDRGDGRGGDAHGAEGNDGEARYYDFFRGRVMFPIVDAQYRPVGFGGRLMNEKEGFGGKYVNSPEGRLFEKRKILFGLAQAAKEIGLVGEALVVEGYVDVVMCHQYGVKNAVATLGTALTPDHLRLLRRHLPAGGRVLALFDADAAGEKAGLAATRLCMAEDVPLALVRGLEHKDPGEFLPRLGAEAFRRRVAGAEDSFEYLLRVTVGSTSERDIDARVAAVAKVMEVVNASPNAIKRDLMRQRVAEVAGVAREMLPEYQPPARPEADASGPRRRPATAGAGGGAIPIGRMASGRTGQSFPSRPTKTPGAGGVAGAGRGAYVSAATGGQTARPGASASSPSSAPSGGLGAGAMALALRAKNEGRRKRYLRLLHHMWANREWCARVADRLPAEQIWDPACWQVARLIRDAWVAGAQPTARDLLARADEPGADAVIADLATGSDALPPSEAELTELLERFEKERGEEKIAAVLVALEQAQRQGDAEREAALLSDLQLLRQDPAGAREDAENENEDENMEGDS